MLLNKISIPVLCYHKVSYNGGVKPEKFEKHLKFMKNAGYKSISARELVNFIEDGDKIPSKSVVLTFDDCFICNWVYAIPLLEKYDFRGVFFPVTNFIGSGKTRPQMDSEELPEIKDAATSFMEGVDGITDQFFNEAELIKTVERGHEVYSHSQSHRMTFRNLKKRGEYPEKWHWGMKQIYGQINNGDVLYTKASAYAFDGLYLSDNTWKKRSRKGRYEFCLKEYKESRKYLEKLLGRNDLDLFCHPWGDFDEVSMQALKDAGYKGSFTLERYSNSFAQDPFYINRIALKDNSSVSWLKNKLEIYGRKSSARLFMKKFKKKREIERVALTSELSHIAKIINETGFETVVLDEKEINISKISNILKEFNPNIIHTTSGKAQIISKIAKVINLSKVTVITQKDVNTDSELDSIGIIKAYSEKLS